MRKAVFSLGNALLGDDSVGLLVLKKLKETGVRADLRDLGWGLSSSVFKDYDRVAVVDAGFFGGDVGEFMECELSELSSGSSRTTHGINLIFLLKRMEEHSLPEVRFFLIQPGNNEKLSDRVKDSVDKVAERIIEYLEE